jgi:hypothetical protein
MLGETAFALLVHPTLRETEITAFCDAMSDVLDAATGR